MKKFSKDPKIRLLSIEDFLENNNYLRYISKRNIFYSRMIPKLNTIYYKITSTYFICITYGRTKTDYGLIEKEQLKYIEVAYRDGKTEYELYNNLILSLTKSKRKKAQEDIIVLKKAMKYIPKYKKVTHSLKKDFKSYLLQTYYKTNNDELKNKYLLLDVETNGLRKANDDLLSITIYDPSTGICYNRFLPLDLQPLVLTGHINAITDKMLENQTHITQEEINWLYKKFHLRDRIILTYSGGNFDYSFIINYFKRHNLFGFNDLHFENIKSRLPKAPYGSEGYLTKDNLCSLFGIIGVSEFHSGYNDCILEWKLFEKIYSNSYLFIDKSLYKYNSNYIIPITYLNKYPQLANVANVKIPNFVGKASLKYEITFPKALLRKIKQYDTNILGIVIEHGLNTYINASHQDNSLFLTKNKSYLEYIGELHTRIKMIPILPEEDGTVSAINEEDEEFINEINNNTNLIIEHIKPIADYIKSVIFKDKQILTQELSISKDRKILALCDLSDEESVVEIKTFNVLREDGMIKDDIARQLYFQANGRKIYIVSMEFITHLSNKYNNTIIDSLNVCLYEVNLIEYND